MRYLYQKDERALPGNLLNRISRFLLSFFLATQCIYVFRMVLTVNSDYFPKQH
jgi:hypothetical protein